MQPQHLHIVPFIIINAITIMLLLLLLLLLFLLSLFLDMMNDIGIDKKQQRYIIKKMINIAIRATYYIFCCRNRNWDSPDLMQFWFFFLAFVLFLFFVFLFNNPISSSICKLPIRSEIYNCTFKNTNKVSVIIIIILKGYFRVNPILVFVVLKLKKVLLLMWS